MCGRAPLVAGRGSPLSEGRERTVIRNEEEEETWRAASTSTSTSLGFAGVSLRGLKDADLPRKTVLWANSNYESLSCLAIEEDLFGKGPADADRAGTKSLDEDEVLKW